MSNDDKTKTDRSAGEERAALVKAAYEQIKRAYARVFARLAGRRS